MENVKLIGYRLIKPEYKEASLEIIKKKANDDSYNDWDDTLQLDGYNFSYGSKHAKWLKQAGVLDIWFEPVYDIEFKTGDWVIGWHCKGTNEKYDKIAWQVGIIFQTIDGHYVRPKKNLNNSTGLEDIRKATPEEIENATIPNIIINGYKAEFFDTYVKFGCAEFDKYEFVLAQQFINKVKDSKEYASSKTNREVQSVTIGAGRFSKEVIKQIVDYYKNREC